MLIATYQYVVKVERVYKKSNCSLMGSQSHLTDKTPSNFNFITYEYHDYWNDVHVVSTCFPNSRVTMDLDDTLKYKKRCYSCRLLIPLPGFIRSELTFFILKWTILKAYLIGLE